MTHPLAIPKVLGCMLLTLLAGLTRGQEARDPAAVPSSGESATDEGPGQERPPVEPQVTEVLTDLMLPGGLILQPETGAFFFVENGAGRVRRILPDKEVADVLTGLAPQTDPDRPDQWMGAFHLAFLDQHHLILGTGPDAMDEGWLRIFPLPGDESAISADPLSPAYALPASEQLLGDRKLTGLALSSAAAFVISHRDESAPWLARLERMEDELGPSADLAAETSPPQGGSPFSMTIDRHGNLVVGLKRREENEKDVEGSELAFCQAKTGEIWVRFPIPLQDITALAYHPTTGRLYALDFAHHTPSQGGLFELMATQEKGKPGVTVRKVRSLNRPTSMRFDASGVLFVTEWGDMEAHTGTGRLLRIEL